MNIPKNLKHKPIIAIDSYEKRDGTSKYSDAKYLSIGRATYDNTEISTKVWRYDKKNKKWKRQSDDLPIHRVFDLGILVLGTLLYDSNSDFSKTGLNEQVVNKDDLKYLQDFLAKNKSTIDDRITILEDLIVKYRKR
jgi:hypothetical protein